MLAVETLEWYDTLGRLVVAAVLGGAVGAERELDGQDAGFRTHLLLALGSALFGAMSVGAFDSFIADRAATNVTLDVTRIASYVAAGVGFIGGGAILKHTGTVRGITTAASLWTVAATGLAAGLGFWEGAVGATVLALVALVGLRPMSRWLGRRSHSPRSLVAVLDAEHAADALPIVMDCVNPTPVRQVALSRSADESIAEIVVEWWDLPDAPLLHDITQRITAELAGLHSLTLRR